MSTYDDDYDDLDDDEGQVEQQQRQRRELSPAELRILKKKAKQWDENEPTLTKLQRENMLLKSDELRGLDEIKREALFSVHRGDLTPEALSATAQALGWVEPPKPKVADDELAAHRRMIEASAGGTQADSTESAMADILAEDNEEAFWAKAQGQGLAR